jgi:glutathione synthase/RimK-type ligase-like ATP-grasp enzyme
MKTVLILSFKRRNDVSTESRQKFIDDVNFQTNSAYKAVFALYSDLDFVIDGKRTKIVDTRNNRDISQYNLVIFQLWSKNAEHAAACATYLHQKGVKYFDQEVGEYRSHSKLTEYYKLWASSLPVPMTLMAPKERITSELLEAYGFKFPLILKAATAKRGNFNFLINNFSELKKQLSTKIWLKRPFLIQQFIENEFDYRAVVFGNELALVLERRRADNSTHLNNTSRGGQGILIEPSNLGSQLTGQIISAARSMKREIAGVDVVIETGTGKFYFLEVNKGPQLNSGLFPDEHMTAFRKFIDGAIDHE